MFRVSQFRATCSECLSLTRLRLYTIPIRLHPARKETGGKSMEFAIVINRIYFGSGLNFREEIP